MTCSIMACTAAVVLASTGTTTSPVANLDIVEADGHRSILPERPEKKLAAKLPLSTQLGFDFIPVPVVSLPPLDHWALIAENELEVKDGAPLRYGTPRVLDFFADDGQWIDVPGGRLWQIEIQAQGAENTRIMIEQMNLPKGAELRMYSPAFLGDVAGPFTDDGPFDTGTVWSGTYITESVVIEYFEHARTKFEIGLPFLISEMTHGFLPILKQGGGLASGAGSCHNHPACHAAWSDIADAAAVVLFSGGYLCSGQLMATSSADETPYYTTASHCISSQSGANSAQFYFFYERVSCTGSYSNGTMVSGADLVATYSTSDNSLLMIRGGLPSGVFFAGWTTADPPSGEDISSVHFPQGDYMRISFGDCISSGVCGSSTNWAGTTWNDGVTEPGSSGAGAYRVSDQKLFGVLTCGASSCSNQSGADGYGRFSRAYSAAFSPHMAAGSDDGYEPNGNCSSATSLGNGTYSNLVVKSVDEDHYALTVAAGSTLNVTVDFSNTNGDIDAQLLSSCGGSVLASGTSHSNDESLSWTNTGTEMTVILRVYLYSDTRNDYNLYISGSGGGGGDPTGACCIGTSCSTLSTSDCAAQGGTYYGDGSSCAEIDCGGGGGGCDDATGVSEGDYSFDTTGSTTNVDLAPYCDPGQFGDDVTYNAIFFAYTASDSGTATASTCNQATFDTRLSAHAGDCEPSSVITCLDDTDGCSGFTTEISFAVVSGETYYIVLGGYSADDSGTGTLSITLDGGGGGSCPAGEIEDCNGNCAPEGWLGDGLCDDGTWEWNGVPIYFNCNEFNCDNGDCTGCDGGGTGACCVGKNCSIQSAADCIAAGGSYNGDDTACSDVDCSGGGGECPTDWTADCKGTCFPDYVYDAWLGDGYCDDCSYIPYDYGCTECPPGVPICMDCDEFNCDNGDCTGCDGGGGECDPTPIFVGDNEVDTSGSVGVTLDLTGNCDPGPFGTDAFLNTSFFEFIAPASGIYEVSTCNQAGWDTRLSVHNGDCTPESVIVCLDDTDGCENYTTTIEFSAKVGTVYVIALGGYSAVDYGPATLTISGDDGGVPTGACCFENGLNCSNSLTQSYCQTLSGYVSWHQGLKCGAPPYDVCSSGQPTGACCFTNGSPCWVGTQTACSQALGEWLGASTTCAECSSNGCMGDLNGDSTVNGSDLTILLGSWGLQGGDLNGDKNTDGADLTLLLGNWGPC